MENESCSKCRKASKIILFAVYFTCYIFLSYARGGCVEPFPSTNVMTLLVKFISRTIISTFGEGSTCTFVAF